ncbi:DUF892 family protein [Bradyrhizobium sp. USDA 4529]
MFHDTLKDICFAENKIIKTLPKMVRAVQSAVVNPRNATRFVRQHGNPFIMASS